MKLFRIFENYFHTFKTHYHYLGSLFMYLFYHLSSAVVACRPIFLPRALAMYALNGNYNNDWMHVILGSAAANNLLIKLARYVPPSLQCHHLSVRFWNVCKNFLLECRNNTTHLLAEACLTGTCVPRPRSPVSFSRGTSGQAAGRQAVRWL